jgi:hypothetical protein
LKTRALHGLGEGRAPLARATFAARQLHLVVWAARQGCALPCVPRTSSAALNHLRLPGTARSTVASCRVWHRSANADANLFRPRRRFHREPVGRANKNHAAGLSTPTPHLTVRHGDTSTVKLQPLSSASTGRTMRKPRSATALTRRLHNSRCPSCSVRSG